MKINTYEEQQSPIYLVKYSAAIFTVEVESFGEISPIDIVIEYRTIVGHGSYISRVNFEVAFDTFWSDEMGIGIKDVISKEIERVFPREDKVEKILLMSALLKIITNFSNNILNLRD